MVPHTPPLNKGLRVWETVRFSAGYQTIDESLLWLKKKDFRYGKNPTYDNVFDENQTTSNYVLRCLSVYFRLRLQETFKNAFEIGNPQPSL
jgi:hypothetical protein